MSNCQDNRPTFLPEAVWKALMNLPALRYMKAPVDTVAQLYEKYPIGNEKGTFAFVHDKNTFYTYHPRGWHRGEWKPISADGVSSFFEIDAEFLKEGDILVYDSNKQKFVVKSGNIWNKLIDKASSVIQTSKFFNEVEELPTNESDAGIYFIHKNEESDSKIVEFRALYIVLGGKAIKIWNSSDYWTKEEVDKKKANQTQVDDIAASVDVLSVTKAEKSVVDALMAGIIKQPAVDTYNDTTGGQTSLLSTYPNPQVGWDVLVRSENTRYNWNGSVWVNMETGNYGEDFATKKYVDNLFNNPITAASTIQLSPLNGATGGDNTLTIPINSTGRLSTIYIRQSPFQYSQDSYVGQNILASLSLSIANYSELTSNARMNYIFQKYKDGSYIGNFNDQMSVTVRNSTLGGSLSRVINMEYKLTQDDINNEYYFVFGVQLTNENIVTQNVTIGVSESELLIDKSLKKQIERNTEGVLSLNDIAYQDISLNVAKRITVANNATATANGFIIPVGSTGKTSTIYINENPFEFNPDITVKGVVLSNVIVLKLTNGDKLTSSRFNAILQYYRNGAYGGNVTLDTSEISNRTENGFIYVTYKLSHIFTQSDIDNKNYYRFALQTTNDNAVTSQVTVDIDSVVMSVNMDIAQQLKSNNQSNERSIKKATYPLYNQLRQINVKKDGTGDFTDVKAAIDSITDASYINQYEIVIHDDWDITDPSVLYQENSGRRYLFATKDFVHIRGAGVGRRISLIFPNNIDADNIRYSQPVWQKLNSRIENLTIIAKNCRYALHTEGNGTQDANSVQFLKNCTLIHLGNHEATNFSYWKSDMAWGFGNSVDMHVNVENCHFYARKQPITFHTNINYGLPSSLNFYNCSFDSALLDDIVGDENKIAIGLSELGSTQKPNVSFYNCRIGGIVSFGGDWYQNITNRNDARTLEWNIQGSGNSRFTLKMNAVSVLKFAKTAYSGNIKVIGGTAKNLIFGSEWNGRKGYTDLYAYTAGSIYIATNTNSTVTNYMDTLGKRLGDCSTTNKTLIIEIDGVQQTITFDKNYAGTSSNTTAPAYTTAQIITEINGKLAGCSVSLGVDPAFANITDIYDSVFNESTTDSILKGMAVVYTKNGYVRRAQSDENVDGIAIEDIPYIDTTKPYDNLKCKIALRNKVDFHRDSTFRPIVLSVDIKGKMLKVNNGTFEETTNESEAVIVGSSNLTWSWK